MSDDDRGEPPRPPASTSMESFESAAASERGALREISTAMVQIYKDQFGRGPTKVRTNYAGRDVLVCTLEHTLTPAERNLQAMGEHQRLRDIRLLFQYAEESRFVARSSGSPGAGSRRSSAASTPTPTSRASCSCCTPKRQRRRAAPHKHPRAGRAARRFRLARPPFMTPAGRRRTPAGARGQRPGEGFPATGAGARRTPR